MRIIIVFEQPIRLVDKGFWPFSFLIKSRAFT